MAHNFKFENGKFFCANCGVGENPVEECRFPLAAPAPPGNEFYFYLYSTWNEILMRFDCMLIASSVFAPPTQSTAGIVCMYVNN
jgi:hypothetical protein